MSGIEVVCNCCRESQTVEGANGAQLMLLACRDCAQPLAVVVSNELRVASSVLTLDSGLMYGRASAEVKFNHVRNVVDACCRGFYPRCAPATIDVVVHTMVNQWDRLLYSGHLGHQSPARIKLDSDRGQTLLLTRCDQCGQALSCRLRIMGSRLVVIDYCPHCGQIRPQRYRYEADGYVRVDRGGVGAPGPHVNTRDVSQLWRQDCLN